MRLEQLGWTTFFDKYLTGHPSTGLIPARVCEESREIYRVRAEQAELICRMAGKIRFLAEAHADFPVVGDWVLVQPASAGLGVIQSILPRRTALSRKSAGRITEQQIVCANIDTVMIVSSLNQDLNLRRLERYLAIAWESGALPVVLLNKCDLCEDTSRACDSVEAIAHGVPVYAVSAMTAAGLDALKTYTGEGQTVVFVGSSGVGKSTLVNVLSGHAQQQIARIREWDGRGRHTTTTRQLFVLPNGGIVIDTPGLREVGLIEKDEGLSHAFEDVAHIGKRCKFRDCQHQGEPDCAVAAAVASGELSADRVQSFYKLQKEIKFYRTKTNTSERRNAKAFAKRIGRAQKRLYKIRNRE